MPLRCRLIYCFASLFHFDAASASPPRCAHARCFRHMRLILRALFRDAATLRRRARCAAAGCDDIMPRYADILSGFDY